MRKLIAMALCAVIVPSMFYTASAKTKAEEPVTMVYAIPGDVPKDLKEGLAAINEKLAADGVNVILDLKYYPWDAWDQKINLMLSTGENFDLFHVMNDRVSLSNYASRDALADITESVNEFGKNILDVCPDIMMRSGQVSGVQYAIPAYWMETALDPELTIRKDILDKYELDMPTSFAELTETFEKVMELWDGSRKPYIPIIGANSARFGLASMEQDEWPYVIYDKVFYVDQDGNVENYFETEAFKQSCADARLWYEKGLISPDVLTTTPDDLNNQLMSGDWFVHPGTVGDITQIANNYPDITVDDFVSLTFSDKTRVRPYGTRNMNAVPLSSKHPEAGVKFLNWVYASQDNYDLFIYGREGIDYEKAEPRNRIPISDPVTGQSPYYFSDWMVGNVEYLRPSLTAPKATNDMLYAVNETAVDGYASMFAFDASKVQTEFADVQTQILANIAPIATGVQPYDKNIDNALKKLKSAGVDKLLKEFESQLKASRK